MRPSWELREEALKALVGHTVVSVHVKNGDNLAVIRTVGGGRLTLELDGDCCSSSYFTKDAQFADLVGAKIVGFEEVSDMPEGFEEYDTEHTDVLSWHFLKFTTDKGHVTIDWRNDSNGYYDGSLSAAFTPGPDLKLAKDIFCVGMDETSAAVWSDYCAENGVEGMEVEK